MVSSAVQFLSDPAVANAPLSRRTAFLQAKGMTPEEIELALSRANAPKHPPPPPPQTITDSSWSISSWFIPIFAGGFFYSIFRHMAYKNELKEAIQQLNTSVAKNNEIMTEIKEKLNELLIKNETEIFHDPIGLHQ